ncbi:hypothetical protein IWW55_003682 [Coemansia sp. RSA 2706]|nr:hypothetical protein LPJ70_007325 [Coemansia sp. RSA 2708]KAJ1832566.1 hypothetical protein LPJ63_003426 [Coemansia sp. RSA 2711]KAJ2301921.1 hypothetical protein IWW55_003682 [Coemansia sp. RSA 2706]KAJ2313345.1 hypothetical protein IWW54_001580 [Coemansia sp. RSA 2705]KAJ2314402.1 hypothetical protein IWW52_004293 [Coemansia sp. RSA 2704]KAJ2324425.1 hypothetical protein IWW51_003283 [Coemansia sp. RSA 2702]KAJ2362419.1 hypothetical protein H4S01_004788 [Coemansia sp. RSA 2610]KAJ238181
MNALEEESLKRQARLQAVREALRNPEQQSASSVLRNFHTEIAKETLSQQRPAAGEDTIEGSTHGVVEQAIDQRREAAETAELDIAAIAPRRANWDLKRELSRRLDELKLENEAAVADIIRARLKESGDSSEIAKAVAEHTAD